MKEAHFFILHFLFERIDKETKKLYLYIKFFKIEEEKYEKTNIINFNICSHMFCNTNNIY